MEWIKRIEAATKEAIEMHPEAHKAVMEARFLECRMEVFLHTKDESLWQMPHNRPGDEDNLKKPIHDAVKRAGGIADDKLVAVSHFYKTWCEIGGAVISYRPLGAPDRENPLFTSPINMAKMNRKGPKHNLFED